MTLVSLNLVVIIFVFSTDGVKTVRIPKIVVTITPNGYVVDDHVSNDIIFLIEEELKFK